MQSANDGLQNLWRYLAQRECAEATLQLVIVQDATPLSYPVISEKLPRGVIPSTGASTQEVRVTRERESSRKLSSFRVIQIDLTTGERIFFSPAALPVKFLDRTRTHIITALFRHGKCGRERSSSAYRRGQRSRRSARAERSSSSASQACEASVSLSQRVIGQVVDLRFHAFTWRPTDPYPTSSSSAWLFPNEFFFPPLPLAVITREAVCRDQCGVTRARRSSLTSFK